MCECYLILDNYRRSIYKDIFPSGIVPIQGPISKGAYLGGDRTRLETVNMIDLSRMTEDQKSLFFEKIAGFDGSTPREVRLQAEDKGIPIKSEAMVIRVCKRCTLAAM